ncbi:ABC transporter permease subunit [Bacillus sp. M6-12]|uniref:ABC transporter permease subunit n=1 Tax=Bacillus sp. M6-12 TaxID=2054166 RepID=UPI0015E0760E|nr:ABC transporter permease subunit [Bacillus sp. M6-12]
MNKTTIIAIAEKDIRATFSSKKVWMPMVILAVVLCIIFPAVFSYIGLHTELLNQSSDDLKKPIEKVIQNFPAEEMKNTLASLPTMGEKVVYYFLNFMLTPFFLMAAIVNSMVTSSNSFAGEKERKTLESLLFSPLSIKDLFLGKVLASFIPTLLIVFSTFILNLIVINLITYPFFNQILFINATWLLLIFWVIPALVLFNILLNVLVSSKVKSFQEAQQFGGMMVLPIVGILISQVTGLFFLSPFILFLIGAGFLLGNALLLKVMTKLNDRNSLFESQIH